MNRTPLHIIHLFTIFLAASIGLSVTHWVSPHAAAQANSASTVTSQNLPIITDYTFLFWPYGWRGRSQDGQRVIGVQTGRFAMALDVQGMKLLNIGALQNPAGYRDAASTSSEALFRLPPGQLELSVRVGAIVYHCTRGAINQADMTNFPVRMIECGRFVERFDILQLEFQNSAGEKLEAESRLEVTAWPDQLIFQLSVTPKSNMNSAGIFVRCKPVPGSTESESPATAEEWKAGITRSANYCLDFSGKKILPASAAGLQVTASDLDNKNAVIPVSFDSVHNWHAVALPNQSWQESKDLDHLERVAFKVSNSTDVDQTAHLLFAKDYGFAGVTGMTPMIRDRAGWPTGIPVQLSKDWHQTAGRHFPNEGPWFHGFSLIHIAAHSKLDLEFDITYGRWGGLPAASHAQLSLVGYGVNQLWDQAALGSWGESITYDPDINLNRSMIDDVRPLMVTQMNTPAGKWAWTNNVGGGDFLAYFDSRGDRKHLTRMRTAYISQGPNLTDVVYAGVTSDGSITARIEVSTPRSNDINRAIHRFRYDVIKPTRYSRMAFYQVGSDNYNDHQFDRMARGDEKGLIEEWVVSKGGRQYDHFAAASSGKAPWISLHQGISMDKQGGAWANRGVVIRSWKARLGGKAVPMPIFASYGTENGVPSRNIELVPPKEITTLMPGDFVEAAVELVIMPQFASDYYGPNMPLRRALAADGNTWKPILREAVGNQVIVSVTRGSLQQSYPVRVQVDQQERANVALRGGLAYVPIVFTGLRSFRGYELYTVRAGKRTRVDQSVHGMDFWQTDFDPKTQTWSITYNVNMDATDSGVPEAIFEFRKE